MGRDGSFFLGALAKLRKVTGSFIMSVRPHETTRFPLHGFLIKLDIRAFFFLSLENMSKKFKFYSNPTRISDTLHKDVFTFLTISRWIILRMWNISNKSCRENQNIHFIFSNFFPENRAVCEIMWKNVVEPERPQLTTQYGGCALNAG
jgi:hypothetical protein